MMGPKGGAAGPAMQLIEALADPGAFKQRIDEFARREERAIAAEDKSSEVIQKAQKEAVQIVASAQMKSEELLKQAKMESEKIKKEIYNKRLSSDNEITRKMEEVQSNLAHSESQLKEAESILAQNKKKEAELEILRQNLLRDKQDIDRKKAILSQL